MFNAIDLAKQGLYNSALDIFSKKIFGDSLYISNNEKISWLHHLKISKLNSTSENEIDEKIFDLETDWGNIDTRVQVISVGQFGRLGEDYGVDIFVNVDPYGTMDYHMYEEGTDNEIEVNDTIDAAYHEATLNYESSDLLGFLRGEVYSLFYEKLEKYGIPIDVDIDLKEF
jgi:hypothetical protein